MSFRSSSRHLRQLALSGVLGVLLVVQLLEPPLVHAVPSGEAPAPRGVPGLPVLPSLGFEAGSPVHDLLWAGLFSRLAPRPSVLLAQASGYDAGAGTAGSILGGYQRPPAQQLPGVPNYSDGARDQYLNNKYYRQHKPGDHETDPLQQDSSAAAAQDPNYQGIQQRVLSPLGNWGLDQSSALLKNLESRVPPDADIPQDGCGVYQYCAQDGIVTSTATCTINQSYDQQVCHEYYTQDTTCNPFDQSGSRSLCDDALFYVQMVRDPATGTIQLLGMDTGPGSFGDIHRNCGVAGEVGGWWLLGTFPATTDVPTVTVTTSGVGCTTMTTTLSTLDAPVNTASCYASGAQWMTAAWSAHADNCRTTSTFHDACTAYKQNPWFELSHTCLQPVPGDVNDCGDLERTFGKLTYLSDDCGPLKDKGCNQVSQQCNGDPCTSITRTYKCTDFGCVDYREAVLCSTCIPDPPGPPRCTNTEVPINTDFGLATAMMEGQVTMGKNHTADGDDVYAFPGFPQTCSSNLLVNCCDTAAAQQMADNIHAATQAVQMTMNAMKVANVAIDFYGYMQGAMTAPIVSQMTFTEAVGFAAQSTFTDFMASMFAFSWAGLVMIVIMVAIMLIQMLMQCSASDTETAAKIKLKLCVPVGSYCGTKILVGCLTTKHAFCCFQTLLSRILQEQIRAPYTGAAKGIGAQQENNGAGISWGEPKAPDCRGLSVEELQAVNWDAIDWTEYLDDLKKRITVPTEASVAQQATQIVNGTDFTGQAANTVAQYGSLENRARNSITVPGKDTLPPTSDAAKSTTLYVSVEGDPGLVRITPSNRTCQSRGCQLSVPARQVLTATAEPPDGTAFVSWGGLCSGTGACSFTLTGTASLSARFARTGNPVAVGVYGPGVVTSTPAGFNCLANMNCTVAFPPGTMVDLTATPNAGALFLGWSAPCEAAGTGVCRVSADVSPTVSADFVVQPRITAFTPTSPGPLPVGQAATWTVTVSGGQPPIEFQFTREDNGTPVLVQDFSPNGTYAWTPAAGDVGTHRLQVAVRNSGASSAGDDVAITDYFTVAP